MLVTDLIAILGSQVGWSDRKADVTTDLVPYFVDQVGCRQPHDTDFYSFLALIQKDRGSIRAFLVLRSGSVSE